MNALADFRDATKSQWYAACSSGGATPDPMYPYGKTFDALACNGSDYGMTLGTHTTTAVGSLAACQASPPYAGVYDLSGNVYEWEDSCGGTADECRVRGGSFLLSGVSLACYFGNSYRRYYTRDYVGFRCCAL